MIEMYVVAKGGSCNEMMNFFLQKISNFFFFLFSLKKSGHRIIHLRGTTKAGRVLQKIDKEKERE
jgi:hypothetical protein